MLVCFFRVIKLRGTQLRFLLFILFKQLALAIDTYLYNHNMRYCLSYNRMLYKYTILATIRIYRIQTLKYQLSYLLDLSFTLYVKINWNGNMIRQDTGNMQIIHVLSWKYSYITKQRRMYKIMAYTFGNPKPRKSKHILLSMFRSLYMLTITISLDLSFLIGSRY